MKRALRLMIGWLALTLGAIAALAFGFALIDPAGTQAANDADPFGTSPSTWRILCGLAFALVLKGCGAWLVAISHADTPAKNSGMARKTS